LTRSRFDITAIIYDKRGRVLSIGKNSYFKTHPYQTKCAERVGLPDKQFLHAEIHAIVKCKQLSKAHKIIVMRFDKSGESRNAKPCPVCQSAIEATSIKIIEHT
jgi:deoxycytidylate deaminase